ncbi:unnamed protein product [Nippostrongylus brasiliensis]|uniref:Thymidylate synthase n=1 Tax=Nippostrongylus brasiliensis TaxID=27835 RepID=A0A0N4XI90_NIPBR|nr:unnamed protein product [Nippostrongylus brasiliensis]
MFENFRSNVMFLCQTMAVETEEVNRDEQQYLNQIAEIIANGKPRNDRTNTGTLSIFGMQSRYSLRNGVVPLLTTKRVYWKGIVEELLWFIRADTDSNHLSEKNVKIWDANGSREFLDNLGFTDRAQGDLGPVYGFQWRHFGAKYEGPKTSADDYKGQGVDQLAEVIHQIRHDPDSRRIIMSAWNPSADGSASIIELSTLSKERRHVPFNIASYGLLTHMIAHVCGLKGGDLVHTLGDAHVYKNHVEALQIQLQRKPTAFPTVEFGEGIKEIDDFTTEKIILKNYKPQGPIKMDMAV